MKSFEETVISRLQLVEREVERMRVKESPDMSSYLGITAKAADSAKLGGIDAADYQKGWIPTGGWKIYQTNWINNVGGAQTDYSIGDKIKLTNDGSTKYFYIISAPTPDSLKISGDSTGLVGAAGTALTNIYYSHATSPVGFPQWFDYTPILTVSGGTAPTYATFINRYCVVGKLVTVYCRWSNGSGGTAGAGTNQIVITLPITAYQENIITGSGGLANGSTFLAGLGIYLFGTYFAIMKTAAFVTGADQNDAYRELSFTFTYEAA
jgi:hypothetical protein